MNQMNHRFTLEPYRGMEHRFICPNCRHRRNTFTRYIDTETQTYLADHVGKCDRLEKCGYHFTPREFFKTNPDDYRLQKIAKRQKASTTKYDLPKEPAITNFDLMPPAWVPRSQRNYHKNNFYCFLRDVFGHTEALALAERYKLGTSTHWSGSTIFWQIDTGGNVRAGKIMLYNAADGKRIKEPVSRVTWVHSAVGSKQLAAGSDTTANRALQTANFLVKQCFFGQHLLNEDPTGKRKVVAIAESEKTAIIANLYYPNYIWLASGSLDGISVDKCKVLAGRKVILFPDVNGYAKWHRKACMLNQKIPTATFAVDDYLTRTATPDEREGGIDIADRWIDAKLLELEVERGFEVKGER
jgi:hypothetical protein